MTIATTNASIYFLEMSVRPEPKSQFNDSLTIRPLPQPVDASNYRQLYYGVGKDWHWLDRMVISEAELEAKINQPNVHIFTFDVADQRVGYVELVEEDAFVEILYFGLFPSFTGKGLGPTLLQWAIDKAWSYGKPLVQLNTCSLDHPKALDVYLKAGFNLVRTETQERKILLSE